MKHDDIIYAVNVEIESRYGVFGDLIGTEQVADIVSAALKRLPDPICQHNFQAAHDGNNTWKCTNCPKKIKSS